MTVEQRRRALITHFSPTGDAAFPDDFCFENERKNRFRNEDRGSFTFILFRTFVLFVQKHRGEKLSNAQQNVLSVDQRHRRLTGRIRFVQPVRFAGVGKFSNFVPIFTERF